jgi:dihydrofolate reductase
MGKIVISENVSIDGVLEDPMGTDGTAFGGWFELLSATDRAAWAETEYQEAMAADTLLFGADTYRWLAPRWADRTGPWADRLREVPIHVLSSTLKDEDLTWGKATLLWGDPLAAVAALRAETPGEVVVNGSGRLARTLIANGLFDELRLLVCPVLVGAGERIFPATERVAPLRLAEQRTIGEQISFLSYRPA